jgi:FkbM family methyltransferase
MPVRIAHRHACEIERSDKTEMYNLPYGVARTLETLVGRRLLWRLGRFLYLYARRDSRNDPVLNGEYALHDKLARFAAARSAPLRAIDIGANIGYWSLHLIEACRRAGVSDLQLWAFEPSDEIRAVLTERLRTVPSGYRVTIRREAVSSASGSAAFDGSSGLSGVKSLLTEKLRAQPELPRVTVPITTLEAILSEEKIEEVDFVKSDVEGFDLSVIQGARLLLRDGRIGLFQFEYNHRWIGTRSFLRDAFDLVDTLRYRVCKIVPDGIESYADWHPELETFFEANFLLVRDDLLKPFRVREGRFDASNVYVARRQR